MKTFLILMAVAALSLTACVMPWATRSVMPVPAQQAKPDVTLAPYGGGP
jgi:hypothetical protein